MKEKTDIVVLDRIDYDELVNKANRTEAEIKELAENRYVRENRIPVRISFFYWKNSENFSSLISFERSLEKEGVWDALDVLEPQIKAWMIENMKIYANKMRDNHETERDCINLRKHVTNLQESTKRLRMRFSILMGYTIVITIILIWLSLLLVSGLQSLLK